MRNQTTLDTHAAMTFGLALAIACAPLTVSKAATFSLLYSFPDDGSAGNSPEGPLTLGPDGNFYGTTYNGGVGAFGTVFKVTPQGQLTTLHDFSARPDGIAPYGAVVFDAAGNLYGTTSVGGVDYGGTVYKITPDGTFSTFYSFVPGDGTNPYTGLTIDGSGNLFGVTEYGGSHGFGAIFKLTSTGQETVLHSFRGKEGKNPSARLLLGEDGTLYGTAASGGLFGRGTAFALKTNGRLSVIHDFRSDGTDGEWPFSGLTFGRGGALYGTTYKGGLGHHRGTVYRITPDGAESVIYTFSRRYGRGPFGDLIADAKGTLYGTTVNGGRNNGDRGVVFKLTPAGKETVLHSFSGPDGAYPEVRLTFDQSGALYGAADFDYQTYPGLNVGTIFKIVLQ